VSALRLTRLAIVERGRRLLGLLAFAVVFLAAGLTARALVGQEGHVEIGELFLVGGYPVVSALLLLGWLLGRYPLIATLVLFAGLFSGDRTDGYARLYSVRPVSFLRVYGLRVLALLLLAFLLSAVLLPIFDVIMLGNWAGPATFVVIACYVLVYAGLTTLLSLFFRNEAWIALGISLAALIWDALRRANKLDQAPRGVAEAIAFILPPQGPLFRVEGAFAAVQPIPWMDVAYIIGYALVLFLAAAVLIVDREL
jgi:hypothetical protein